MKSHSCLGDGGIDVDFRESGTAACRGDGSFHFGLDGDGGFGGECDRLGGVNRCGLDRAGWHGKGDLLLHNRNGERAVGTADLAGGREGNDAVHFEVERDFSRRNVLVQFTADGRRNRIAPVKLAVVRAVLVRGGAAFVERNLDASRRKRVHRAGELNICERKAENRCHNHKKALHDDQCLVRCFFRAWSKSLFTLYSIIFETFTSSF